MDFALTQLILFFLFCAGKNSLACNLFRSCSELEVARSRWQSFAVVGSRFECQRRARISQFHGGRQEWSCLMICDPIDSLFGRSETHPNPQLVLDCSRLTFAALTGATLLALVTSALGKTISETGERRGSRLRDPRSHSALVGGSLPRLVRLQWLERLQWPRYGTENCAPDSA